MPRNKTVTDHELDKSRFAALVRLAQHGRGLSQREFANQCNISITHLSRCVTGKLDSSPSIGFIQKIADNSNGAVSFKDLLDAAGYDSSKYLVEAVDGEDALFSVTGHTLKTRLSKPKLEPRTVHGCLLGYLSSKPALKAFSIDNSRVAEGDLMINLEKGSFYFEKWHFIFLQDYMIRATITDYLRALPDMDPKIKISYVTTSKRIFRQLTHFDKCSIIRASAILLDESGTAVVEEEYINPSELVTEDEQKQGRII